MFKRLLLVFVLISMTGSLVFAQTAAEEAAETEEKPTFEFDLGLVIGLASYEDYAGQRKGYQKIGLYPKFSYGKWRFGFDFTLEFDGDFKLRDLDGDGKADTWITLYDWLYKLQYVGYAQKGDPIFGLIGEFDSYSLGYGMLMEGFNNTLFYPYILQRGLLFDFDARAVRFPYIGIETVANDVLDWDVIGARLYVRPLAGLSSPVLKGLEFGGTVVADFDPLQEYSSTDTKPPKNNPASETVTTFGVDAGLPIIMREDMDLVTFADWSLISGKGNGFTFGTNFRYAWFTLNAQLRYLGKRFVPHYFDPFYWVERPLKYNSLDLISEDYFGYLVGTDIDLFGVVILYFMWEDGLIDVVDPRIRTGIVLGEDVFRKIGFHITYDKKGIDSFKAFADLNNSLFEALFEYRVTDTASIVFIQKQSFAPSGKSVPQTNIETRFLF